MFQVLITTVIATNMFSDRADYLATSVIANFISKEDAEIAIKLLVKDVEDNGTITYRIVRLYSN